MTSPLTYYKPQPNQMKNRVLLKGDHAGYFELHKKDPFANKA